MIVEHTPSSMLLPYSEMPVYDPGEDCIHCLVIKIIDGHHVEVAQKTRRDRVAPPT